MPTPAAEPVRLLLLARRLIEDCGAPAAAAFLAAWPDASRRRTGAGLDPSLESVTLPALRWLPRLVEAAPPVGAAFVAALAAAAPGLAWKRTYPAHAVAASFFENYGWAQIAGLGGPVESERLACGVLLLGPDVLYPAHRHAAEELYLPLSGTAEWRQGAGGWAAHPPGSVIHHASDEPHAMRTGGDPLLALYLWRGDDLAQQARLD